MCCRGLQRVANAAYLGGFLFYAFAPHCVSGGIRVVLRGIFGDARCRSSYSAHGWPDRVSDEGRIALFYRCEELVALSAPNLWVEDLDLYGAGVPGVVDRRSDAP